MIIFWVILVLYVPDFGGKYNLLLALFVTTKFQRLYNTQRLNNSNNNIFKLNRHLRIQYG